MQFSDLSLVMQIVVAVVSAWVTVVLIAIWLINVYEARRRASLAPRAIRTLLSLALVWLFVEGYVAALARWFTVRNEISAGAVVDLVWALLPGLNILYAWSWLIDILAFNGRFIGALFGVPA